MDDFIAAAMDRTRTPASPWMERHRAAGEALWRGAAMPTRKTEAWKYTSLRPLVRGGFLRAPQPAAAAADLAATFAIDGLDAAPLVFVNGRFSAALSADPLPRGLEMVRLADVDADTDTAAQISAWLGQIADREQHLFAPLADAWLEDGVFLRVAAGVRVARPIQLVWLTLPQSDPFAIAAHTLVVVERGAALDLVEQFAGAGADHAVFTNGLSQFLVEEGAQLTHYRLQTEPASAIHIGGVHTCLQRDARFESFHLGLGSTLKRLDIVTRHAGPTAHCTLNGIYLPQHQQHVDYHTTIEHESPGGTSSETFRGIVADQARAVFNGRIHIHPHAQKTRAELSNRNLLTSATAQVNSKPELEIYADDVQCAHGATVAQVEQQAIDYLRIRGIDADEAALMLGFGFINELLDGLRHPQLAAYLRPQLARILGRPQHPGRSAAAQAEAP